MPEVHNPQSLKLFNGWAGLSHGVHGGSKGPCRHSKQLFFPGNCLLVSCCLLFLIFFPDCVCFGSRDGTDVYWRLYDVRTLALKTSKYKLPLSTLVDGSLWIFLITKPQSAKIQIARSCNLGNLVVFLAGASHVMVW